MEAKNGTQPRKTAIYFAVWVVCTLGFALGGALFLNIPKLYRLSNKGIVTEGRVDAKEPLNHQTIHYSFTVGRQTYYGTGHGGNGNPGFKELQIGDPVRVSYNPSVHEESYMGDPASELESLTRGMIIIAFFPTIVIVIYVFRKRTKAGL